METLRVLIVEDDPDDLELLLAELTRGGLDVVHERVDRAADLRRALEGRAWDIVLSDYTMPGFSGLDAIRIVREQAGDLPVIVISGTIEEEAAVSALRAGACDFVTKGKMTRLLPAIDREVKAHSARVARREVEGALVESELRYRRLYESGMIGVFTFDRSGRVIDANDAFLEAFGMDRRGFDSDALWCRARATRT